MNIKKQFQYDPAIDVSASQIGISKWNWVTVKSSDFAEAIEIMKANRFDVLPIENEDGTITHFYSTQEWNVYENLNKNKINEASEVYYRLSLKDLVKKFNNEDKHFYFLTDYEQTLGLVSYVNLNCQLVYNYLFFIIADIERSVSELLKQYIEQSEVLAYFQQSEDKHVKDLFETFNSSIATNNDSDIFQHMYLQTVGITLKEFHSKLPVDCIKLNKYYKKFLPEGGYNSIRNKVMHPVRPILSDKESIDQIDELLTDYDIIKEIIENHNNKI